MNTKHTKNKILTNVCMASITSICYGAHLDAMNAMSPHNTNFCVQNGDTITLSFKVESESHQSSMNTLSQSTGTDHEIDSFGQMSESTPLQKKLLKLAYMNAVEEISALSMLLDKTAESVKNGSSPKSPFYNCKQFNKLAIRYNDLMQEVDKDVVKNMLHIRNLLDLTQYKIGKTVRITGINDKGEKIKNNIDCAKYLENMYKNVQNVSKDNFVQWLCGKFVSIFKKKDNFNVGNLDSAVCVEYETFTGVKKKAIIPAFIYKASLSNNDIAGHVMKYYVLDGCLKELKKIIWKEQRKQVDKLNEHLNTHGEKIIKLLARKDDNINTSVKECCEDLLIIEIQILYLLENSVKSSSVDKKDKTIVETQQRLTNLLHDTQKKLRKIYRTYSLMKDCYDRLCIQTLPYSTISASSVQITLDQLRRYKEDIINQSTQNHDNAYITTFPKMELAKVITPDCMKNYKDNIANSPQITQSSIPEATTSKATSTTYTKTSCKQSNSGNINLIYPSAYTSSVNKGSQNNDRDSNNHYSIDISLNSERPYQPTKKSTKRSKTKIEPEAGRVDSLSLSLNSNTMPDSIMYKPGKKITQSPTSARKVSHKLNNKQMIDKITINSIKKCDTLKEVIEVLHALGFRDSEIQNIIQNIRSGSTKISGISDDVVSAISAKIAEIDELNTESRVIKRSRTTRKIRDSEREVESQDVDDVFAKPIKKSRSSSKMKQTSAKRKSGKPVVVEIDQDGGHSGYQTNYVVDGVQLHRQYS